MTQLPSTIYTPRQTHLYHDMRCALENSEEKRFSLLQAYWVHRYGLLTMPRENQFQSTEPLDVLSSSIESYPQESIDGKLEAQGKNLEEEKEEIFPDQEDSACELNQIEQTQEKEFSVLQERLLDTVVNNKDSQSSALVDLPRPPSPALHHLRRWLPGSPEDLPKAS